MDQVDKAIELLTELQAACLNWFRRIRGGLQVIPQFVCSISCIYPLISIFQKPYDIATAQSDQQKILDLFAALQEELRKTGRRL